jgi:hypothetical protein
VSRVAAALVGLLLLVAACGPGRVVRRGRVNDDALAVVRRTLPTLRGLPFTAAVPALALSPEEITALVTHDIEQSYRPGDLERLEAVYVRLGLLPATMPLRTALQRLYEQEGAGFYDPRQKRLLLASRALGGGLGVTLLAALTGRDLTGEFLVAHELTHALQDQHFGLPTEPTALIDGDGDRQLARHALLEGDATLAGFGYVVGGTPDRATISRIQRSIHAAVPRELAARYPDVPDLVRTTVAFVYDDGTAFAGWALAEGGWAAVDRVHRDPPDSTEQVLHPARYYAARDRPVDIALAGTETLEAAAWRRTVEDSVGELHLRVLARRVLPDDQAARVADGWGGDRLRVLERGGELLLVWMTAWDSPAEATEFAAALPAMIPASWAERRAERVLVVLAPAGVDEPGLARRVWAATRVRRG